MPKIPAYNITKQRIQMPRSITVLTTTVEQKKRKKEKKEWILKPRLGLELQTEKTSITTRDQLLIFLSEGKCTNHSFTVWPLIGFFVRIFNKNLRPMDKGRLGIIEMSSCTYFLKWPVTFSLFILVIMIFMAYFTGSNVIYNTSQFFVENILTAFFVVVFLLISHWMTKN